MNTNIRAFLLVLSVSVSVAVGGTTLPASGSLPPGQFRVRCLAFSPQGSWLAVAGGNDGGRNITRTKPLPGQGFLKLYDGKSFEGIVTFKEQFLNTVIACGFENEASVFGVSDHFHQGPKSMIFDGTVINWFSTTTKKLSRKFFLEDMLQRPTEEGACDPAGSWMCRISNSQRVLLEDLGKSHRGFHIFTGLPSFYCFSPDSEKLLLCPPSLMGNPPDLMPLRDCVVRLYRCKTGKIISAFNPDGYFAESAAFSPDGTQLAVASQDQVIYVLRNDLKNVSNTFKVRHHSPILAFAIDGKSLAVKADPTTIVIYNVATGQRIRTFDNNEGGVCCFTFSPNGRLLAVGCGIGDPQRQQGNESCVRIWNVDSGELLKMLKM